MPGYRVRTAVGHAVEKPLWQALATAPAPASVAELHLACNAHPNAIQHRLCRWQRAGLVNRIEGRPLRFAMSELAANDAEPPSVAIDGRAKPRKRTARARLWTTMRILSTFDVPQLCIAASASRRSVEDYLNCLARAGHVRMVQRGNSAGTWAMYRLVRNTGPRAPSVSHGLNAGVRVRALVDHNTGQRHDISPGRARLNARADSSDAAIGGGRS